MLGAGLEATTLSRGPVTGSLAFAESDGVLYSSGRIEGQVSLVGPLSESKVTLGVAPKLGPGSRQWLSEVTAGAVGAFLPGDDHDAIYTTGSLYATVTLDADRLEQAAALRGLLVDVKSLGGTGIHARPMPADALAPLRRHLERVHSSRTLPAPHGSAAASHLLDALIVHFAREPRPGIQPCNPQGLGRIVSRAREFIEVNLEEPLAVDAIALASHASRRTLFRAFITVLGESPSSYVRRRRLHRIRHDLITHAERTCTIALVANRWGMGELGRLSGRYRELFGELPSQTVSRGRNVTGVHSSAPRSP